MISTKSLSPLAKLYGKNQNRYNDLIQQFPLRPIRNEKELDSAIKIIDSLLDQPKLTKAEDDYLLILGDIVSAYEDVHHPIPRLPFHRKISSLLESQCKTQVELSRSTKIASSTISEFVSGKRKPTSDQIVKLARFFKIEPSAFLPSDTD